MACEAYLVLRIAGFVKRESGRLETEDKRLKIKSGKLRTCALWGFSGFFEFCLLTFDFWFLFGYFIWSKTKISKGEY